MHYHVSASPMSAQFWCRLKKVQGKKKRDTEAAEALRKAQLEEEGEQESKIEEADDDTGNTDLLSSKDQDVIF